MNAQSKQSIVRKRDEIIERRKTQIIDELRELHMHSNYRNVEYTIESIDRSTINFHVVVKFAIEYYETHFDSMIVKYNDVYEFQRSFRYFDIIHEINI